MTRKQHASTSSTLSRNLEIKLSIARWKALTGENQYELAKKLGISAQYLSQIVRGDRPGTKYIDRIVSLIQAS